MKKIICLLGLLVFLTGCCCKEKNDKYEIKHVGNITIMLDKESGLAWRNVWCDNKDKIPHCWALMEYSGAIVPDGEQKRRNDTPLEDLLK